MELKTIRIKNFRSIKDSGIWKLSNDRINTIIGRNGSGKTSIIEALNLLKQNKIPDKDKPLDLPDCPTEISIGILFSEEEKDKISFLNLSKDKYYSEIIKITKIYNLENSVEYLVNDQPSFTYLYLHISEIKDILKDKNSLGFKEGNNPVQLKEIYSNKSTLMSDIKRLKEQLRNNEKRLNQEKEKIVDLKKNISSILDVISKIESFDINISKMIPTFTIFRYEDFHPFEDRFLYKSEYNHIKILKILLNELGTDFKTLKSNANNPQATEHISDSRNGELERYINENWPRDGAQVNLKIYPNEFAIMIKELDSEIYLYLSQRSGGEIWIFIFLTFVYTNVKSKKNTIILIDEPSINLHPYAQRNVVALLEDFLKKNQNVSIIYTTHTPYLIKSKKIERLVLVKRLSQDGSIITQFDFEKLLNIKNSRPGKKKKLENIKTRLLQILSISVREGFFGVMVLICEGITEYLSLPVWANMLGRDFDESGIIIISAGSKNSILDYVDLFSIYKIPIYLVFDNDNRPENDPDKIKETRKLNKLMLEAISEYPKDFPSGAGEKYFAFEKDYESCLSSESPTYNDYKEKTGIIYGSCGKAVRAMNIALEYQKNDEEPPSSIRSLIEGIFKFREKYC